MKLIMENWRKFISEVTEEEASHIEDAMKVPIKDYPFGDIFGDSYRKIMRYQTIDPSTNFGNAVDLLRKFGWKVDIIKKNVVKNKRIKRKTGKKVKVGDQEFDETETVTVMDASGKPERVTSEIVRFKVSKPVEQTSKYMKDGKEIVNVRTKVLSLKPAALFNKMIEFVAKSEELEEKTFELWREIRALNDKYEEVFEAPKNEGTEEELEKISITTEQKKKEAIETSNYIYSGMVKWYAGGDYGEHQIKAAFWSDEDEFVKRIKKARDYFNDGTRMEELSNNYNDFLKTQYFILSRHPMDVFRMSDHENLGSCHTPPSSRDRLHPELSAIWDEYNICILSEVYGNGMIVYSVPTTEFARAGIPPTQEALDDMGDEEIFLDDERGISGLKPDSRIRIKNLAFHDPKGKEEPISIASPQGKIYGKKTPDFDTYIFKKLAEMQKGKIESIIAKFPSGEIDMSEFTRYGGSYEDVRYGVENVLPTLFFEIDPDLYFHGTSLYDKDMENTMMLERGSSATDRLRSEVETLVTSLAENTGHLITFDIVVVEGTYSGEPIIQGFEMWCQLNLVGQLTETAAKKDMFDLRENIQEAVGELAQTGGLSGNWETVSYDEVDVLEVKARGNNKYTAVVRYKYEACKEIFGREIDSVHIEQISAAIATALPYLKEIYDRVDGSVNKSVEKHLEKEGIFTSDEYALDAVLKKHKIPSRETYTWWDEEEIEKREDDEGNEYISSIRFSAIVNFSLQDLATDMLGEDTSDEDVIAKNPEEIRRITTLLAKAFNQIFGKSNIFERIAWSFTNGDLTKGFPQITIDYKELSYDRALEIVTSSSDWLGVPISIKLENDKPENLNAGIELVMKISDEMMEDKVLEAIHGFLEKQAGALSENKRRIKIKIIRG